MDHFEKEQAAGRTAIGLLEAQYAQLRAMIMEGTYEVTIRTRTQTMTFAPDADLLNTFLFETSHLVHNQVEALEKEVEGYYQLIADDRAAQRQQAQDLQEWREQRRQKNQETSAGQQPGANHTGQ